MSDDSNAKLAAGKLFSVDGLVVVITGAGSGLGAMMARALALNGASKVFIIGRRESSLQQTASSIPSSSNTIIPIVGDVTDKSSLKNCFDMISSQTTHIDVLVANSGVTGPGVPLFDESQNPLPLDKVVENMLAPSAEDTANTFLVNVVGVQLTIATFLPLLDAANKKRPQPPSVENFTPRPQIITTASIGGYNRKPFGNITYGPSKAAVLHLTKQLATAFVPYDIRVNAIAPGYIQLMTNNVGDGDGDECRMYLSEMTQKTYTSQNKTEIHNVEGTFPKSFVPATRTGDEEDMAGVILWLCSRAGAYVNGNVVVTDGGRLSVMPASY